MPDDRSLEDRISNLEDKLGTVAVNVSLIGRSLNLAMLKRSDPSVVLEQVQDVSGYCDELMKVFREFSAVGDDE